MDEIEKKRASCRCQGCQDACRKTPGWMAPGQAAEIAKYMGITKSELYKSFLVTDYWCPEYSGDKEIEPETMVLAPASDIPKVPGKRTPYEAGIKVSWGYGFQAGTCIFFNEKNGRCKIHAVKPIECRVAVCCDKGDSPKEGDREKIKDLWKGHQDEAQGVFNEDTSDETRSREADKQGV